MGSRGVQNQDVTEQFFVPRDRKEVMIRTDRWSKSTNGNTSLCWFTTRDGESDLCTDLCVLGQLGVRVSVGTDLCVLGRLGAGAREDGRQSRERVLRDARWSRNRERHLRTLLQDTERGTLEAALSQHLPDSSHPRSRHRP